MIEIDWRPFAQSTLAKYPTYIGTCNYADVLSMTEYIQRNAISTSPKQLEFVSTYPYIC